MAPVQQLFAGLAGLGLLVQSTVGATLVASHFSGGIYTLSLTTSGNSGQLSIVSQTSGCGTTPGWLESYPKDGMLYCFDESWTGSGQIAEYRVGVESRLTLTGQLRTSGNTAHGMLYGGPDGKSFAATAEYSPSTITTYRLPLIGGARLQQEKFTLAQRGSHPRQDASHPHEVHVDPTGKFMLVPDLGADLIRIFRVDSSSGRLTSCGTGQAGRGDGPRHVKFWKSADGSKQKVYSVNELGNSVSAWDVTYPSNSATGCLSLTRTQTLTSLAPGTRANSETKAAELRVVGSWLYASNRADAGFSSTQDSIAIYAIDQGTGNLTWQEAANSYSHYPRTFAFNKNGTLVAIGGQTSSNVAILSRDPATGKLGNLVANIQVGQRGRAGEEDGLSAVVWTD